MIFLFYIAKRIKNKQSDRIHNFFKNFNLLNGLSRDYIGREKYIFENISSEILPKQILSRHYIEEEKMIFKK